MATLGSCNPLPTYELGTPLTLSELCHQLHLDIEHLREEVEAISTYCPTNCSSKVNKALVNAVQKAMRLEELIKVQPPTDRVVIDNGKKTAVCYRKQLACGQPILYCWIDGTTDSFTGSSIEEAKSHPSLR
jgi:hypothetical protein